MHRAAHERKYLTSDVMLIISLVSARIIEYIFPTSFPIEGMILIVAGSFLIVLAWILIFTVKRELKKFSQPSKPLLETTQLVKTGIFSYSRNPLYLGVLILNVGIGVLFDSAIVAGSTLVTYILITHFLILPEEKYLAEQFKEEFVAYKKNVRRWI